MDYFIGVDIGTSGTKAIAMTPAGRVNAAKHISYQISQPKPGYSEQDPEILLRATLSCIRSVVRQMKSQPLGISFSAAMHGLMAVDGRGRALCPMITWADSRSQEEAAALKKSGQARTLVRRTGTPVHPMSPLCKLIWMRKHQTFLFRKASRFVSVKEYIFFRFFGVWVIDHSLAAATGLLDLRTRRWYPQALRLAGIGPDRLSTPVDTETSYTGLKDSYSGKMGLKNQIPFIIGASDGCLANLGTGAIGKGIMAVTVGTSGAVRVASSSPVSDPRGRIFNYPLTGQIIIAGGPVNSGGIVLEWFRDHFMPGHSIDQVIGEAMQVPAGADGLVFIPYIQGERAPVWNGEARGIFAGVDIRHGRAHFARAVLEGICYNICVVQRLLEDRTGKATQIRLSGGILHSLPWSRMMTDILRRKTLIAAGDDASAMGAALLAMISMGRIGSLNKACGLVRPARTLKPDRSVQKAYSAGLEKFQGMIRDLIQDGGKKK
ncbi:MAG TPA: gluconokinase [Chitinophagaceae bacterium]|nr:gluconokinase [Chitinophagaceae bacterium]